MITASGSRDSAAAAREPAISIRLPPGFRAPTSRSACAWLVNTSNSRPGVAIASTSSQGMTPVLGHLRERQSRVLRDGRDERRGDRRLHGDDDLAGAHGAVVMLHDDAVPSGRSPVTRQSVRAAHPACGLTRRASLPRRQRDCARSATPCTTHSRDNPARAARLSAATRELITNLGTHMQTVAARFDRTRSPAGLAFRSKPRSAPLSRSRGFERLACRACQTTGMDEVQASAGARSAPASLLHTWDAAATRRRHVPMLVPASAGTWSDDDRRGWVGTGDLLRVRRGNAR